MRDLDETDLRILELLSEDARRPYSDIADRVGLSGPAVSERVSRLQREGIVRRFTVDVDQSTLRAGAPMLVTVEVAPADAAALRDRVVEAEDVEHVFVTAESDVVCFARADPTDVRAWLGDLTDDLAVDDVDVVLIDEVDWTPSVGGAAFDLTCAECGNSVDSQGETSRLDDTVYHFCCASCQGRFEERYDRFEAESTA